MKKEELAYWYFRLNGFMTTVNFVLHPRTRGSQRTDADILGVRFPYRWEFPEGPECDEPEFALAPPQPFFVIAEVTRGPCKLNGPWTDPARENVDAVLRAVGIYPPERVPIVAAMLNRQRRAEDWGVTSSLFCVGNSLSPKWRSRYPLVPQKTWTDITRFIWNRFDAHRPTKTDIEQWGEVGRELSALSARPMQEFEREIRQKCGLPAG